MTSQFTQRRECRAAAFQYLYAWSVNSPANLANDLQLFFEHLDKPRDHYAFAEELIHGAIEHVACDMLLLACNGFGGDAELVRELLPEMRDATFAGHAGNDGSAILWGQALGAASAGLCGYQGHGSWVVPQGALMTWAVMMEGGVQLNARGERFHDETQGYSEAAVDVLAQPGGVAWNVFGDAQLALAREFPDFREADQPVELVERVHWCVRAGRAGVAKVAIGGFESCRGGLTS